MKEAKFFTRRP